MDADHATLTAVDQPAWLTPWLSWLDLALHREILRLRARYELSMDELRGLYVSDEQVDRLVARNLRGSDLVRPPEDERRALVVAAAEESSPLVVLADRIGLGRLDLMAVVLCLAPEVDLSYQTLYAYLNDDVSRRLPTVDLCDRIAQGGRLEPHSAVVAESVVEVQRQETAPLWRSAGLFLSEPVRQFLLGDEAVRSPSCAAVRRPGLVLLESRAEADALTAARELARHDQTLLVTLDASIVEPDRRLRYGLLSARLRDAALFASSPDVAASADVPGGSSSLQLLVDSRVPVLLGVRPGEIEVLSLQYVDHQHLVVDQPDADVRTDLWSMALARSGVDASAEDIAAVATMFGLGPAQISAAAASVARQAQPDLPALAQAARERAAVGFDGLVERVSPTYTWSDLVLPTGTTARIHELVAAVRLRRQVFDEWAMGRLVGGHSSVRALFAGPSGTGKTMSAAVLARELGLELHRVDLSALVSKYIGETEKNLAKVFTAAEQSAAILFFDEADALFGKRTEVKDAHDRYANIETSFMLQRMETFDGVVILATNLAGNLDEAFSRRIQFHVEFPMPDARLREELWRKALPASAPVDDDVDPAFLAGMFPMTGGDVRSASLIAAFLAAREGSPIGMRHLVTALARQRRQQGKVPSVSEFKGYLRLVRDEDG
jgi:hypothetical protein